MSAWIEELLQGRPRQMSTWWDDGNGGPTWMMCISVYTSVNR